MFNRDSWVWLLALAGAVVLYLSNTKPPTEWGYSDFLAAAAFLIAWLSGKLATSPLPGKPSGLPFR